MAEAVVTPYASAVPFFSKAIPAWLDVYNAQRLASYDLYDDMYDNKPDMVSMLLRGSDNKAVYVPTAKRIINNLARYVGRGWGFAVDPLAGTPAERQAATECYSSLFVRERMLSQFVTGKHEWLRRGDWVWQITADPSKPEGKRISIRTIDPRTYFPISVEDDIDRIAGVQLIEEFILDDGTTTAIKEQRWLKYLHPDHPNYVEDDGDDLTADQTIPEEGFDILYESRILALEDWQDPAKQKVLRVLTPEQLLPGIKAIPIYHIKNGTSTSLPFGTSDLSGLETVIAAINQAVTDEDLAIALAGLGLYVTDSGAPDGGWRLGPTRVVEVGEGGKFEKLEGVETVVPNQTHIDYLEEHGYGTTGLNDIALGKSGANPKSGIALAIEMAPLFDTAADRNLQINDVLSQMFYDLKVYFDIYEGISLGDAIITSETDEGDLLPFDREARWKELMEGHAAGIFSTEFVHRKLIEEFGYDLTNKDLKAATEETATKAAQADPFAARAAAELADPEGGDDSGATPPAADA